jgi:hypothetical protein
LKKEEVTALLLTRGYAVLDEDAEFNYLKKMPMDSVTEENVAKIMNERDKKAGELEAIKSKPIVVMWEEELVGDLKGLSHRLYYILPLRFKKRERRIIS